MHKYILPAALLALVLACNHQKHSTAQAQKPQNPHWSPGDRLQLDPNVNAESQSFYNPTSARETDILHTKLDVRFDWGKRYMYGKATITAKPYFYASNKMELDARGMEIRRVAEIKRIPGNSTFANDTTDLKFEYTDKKHLRIDLGRQVTRNDRYTVFIDYVAKPEELTDLGGSAAISEDKGLYFINPDGKIPNKPMQIWTQGETQANSVWFPTVDRPNEKMTDEIYMTVEDKYKTLSNGVLADSKKNADGTRTDHWRMDLPHASYLLMMAVGDFAIVKDKWRDRDVLYYVEPQYEQYARQTFGKTPEMMECFSKRLGVDYAWPEYAQVCARDYVSGAMENTTATLHSDFLQRDDREFLDRTYEEYISHELFHQWFGDLVTCESWSNLPLNESFATYGEYLWDEYKYGKDYADIGHYESLQGYLNESAAGHATEAWPGKREPLIRFNYTDKEDMFDGHSYNKGGQVLHLLRQYVGDDAFFASLKLYLETNKFGNAEIHDLRLAFEKTTGQDLNWFFNEWFLSPGHPELDITYSYDAAKMKERVVIRQLQDRNNGTPVFRIPLSIDIYEGGKTVREEVIVKSVSDTFYFNVSGQPDLVNVDAQKTLPCYKWDHHTPQEWAFMYNHSSLYVDHIEALEHLAELLPDGKEDAGKAPSAGVEYAHEILTKALSDPNWSVRETACELLGTDAQTNKAKLVELSKYDPKSLVRASALQALSDNASGDDLKDIYLAALNDKSYTVLSRGLTALVVHFHETGMAEAKKRESDPARGMKLAVAAAYAKGGSDEQQPWFDSAMNGLYGLYMGGFLGQYHEFLFRRCQPATVENAVPGIEKVHNENSSTTATMGTRSVIISLYYGYKGKSNSLGQKIEALKSVKKDATGLQKLEAEKAEVDHLLGVLEAAKERMKE
jgi:aminopeptidase N